MTRCPFIHGLVCGLGLLSLTGIPAIGTDSPKDSNKPNVVLIMTADQGYGDLCGLRAKPILETDGLSLKPVLERTRQYLDERILVESFRGIVMTQQWRLVEKRELYDIQKNPGQAHNLAAAHRKAVAQLKAELERVNQQTANPDHRYVIGSDRQNPVEFTPDHWHGARNGASRSVI